MADRKKTPDVMADLMGLPTKSEDTESSGDERTSTPAHQHTSAPAPEVRRKATYYIAPHSLEELEQGWQQLRLLVPIEQRRRVSKSLIVETALQLALDDLSARGAQSQLAARFLNS